MATILIISEDIKIQDSLQRILQEQSYEVTTTNHFKSALTSIEDLRPDLILYAWLSEGVEALSAIQALKSHAHLTNAAYLLLTTPELINSQFSDLETLINDWIFDPIAADELTRRISHALKKTSTSTNSVEASSPQLQQTLEELDFAKQRLIKGEKFSTLGQMMSGIIHEINNPISVVKGNVSHVTDYAQDLIDLVELYGEEYPEPTPEIEERIEEIDLEFLLEDLPQVLTSMKSGAERIRDLVESLRSMYRVDDSEEQVVDLHQILDNIVLILQSKLKGKKGRGITVIKDYGQVPSVKCYPGQLNQAFMNLLNNAIDALEERRLETDSDEPTIWIQTEIISEKESESSKAPQAIIRIKDNGTGISDDVKKNIFEPFFTTKSIGTATGFGLNTCHQVIVETHRGQLECVSQPGEGTELIVSIPVA
ncbi:MAG: ATP-binding protein [Cyanobacteriota bacterium]|nr:ATP-binding protein [Cyanobacteriota bacterium]